MIKKVSKTTKIVLLILLILFFGSVVVFGDDKVGQGDVVDLTDSKPKEGVVFAVCIFAVGEDGTKYLVDHRHAENMGECIKKRREAVNKNKDPKHRELMGGTRFIFMCDKVKAEVFTQFHFFPAFCLNHPLCTLAFVMLFLKQNL